MFSLVTLQRAQTLRNILLTYFSPNRNDNLSSFTGTFKAENANNKIQSKECAVATLLQLLKRLTHFYWAHTQT